MKPHRGNMGITEDNTYKRLSAVSDSHLCLKVVLSQLILDMHAFAKTAKWIVFPIGKMGMLPLPFGPFDWQSNEKILCENSVNC